LVILGPERKRIPARPSITISVDPEEKTFEKERKIKPIGIRKGEKTHQ
jgi:hypothetical protein